MGELRTRMENDMTVRGMAPRTQEAYVGAVRLLTRFYQRSPAELTDREVQAYLLHLMQERHLSWSTCNIAAHGFRFLYHVTLGRDCTAFCIPTSSKPQRLPEILSREEVRRLLGAVSCRKHRALLMTTYAAGLRVSEVVALRLTDLDAARGSLRVTQGKGAKDRYTLLSPRLLTELRAYWREYRPAPWLFPGKNGTKPLDVTSAQRAYGLAKLRARITKRGGIHALRHAFATHLLEAGTALPTIQRLLGHSHITSTMRYLHLAQPTLLAHTSPLDLLDLPEASPPA